MILLDAVDEGGQGPLGINNDLVVDTLPPYVLDVASSKPNGKFLLFAWQSKQ